MRTPGGGGVSFKRPNQWLPRLWSLFSSLSDLWVSPLFVCEERGKRVHRRGTYALTFTSRRAAGVWPKGGYKNTAVRGQLSAAGYRGGSSVLLCVPYWVRDGRGARREGRGAFQASSGSSCRSWAPRPGRRPEERRKGVGGTRPRPAAAMNSNVENLPPHIIRLVYKEVTTLTADPPDGIKVFPNEEDLTDLQVTIEGPEGTPYAGGLFRMKLLLGKDFPASPPKGYFLTKIFHPNVGANGEICVNVLKRDWKAELGIRHVLLTIKCLLIHPNPESALNEEAGRLLLENYEEYAARARLLTEIHGGAGGPSARIPAGATAAASADPATMGGAEGPMAKKHAGERDKKLAAKKKTDKKRALRRL
ncbi:ubiquitin-conjugating enzyme E2 S [Octodon degus]|uniref:E2 ubiquitin-conjugating enzyme n=1 Tax=Octodon degus TaxID=10160 RepID=A0A6P3FI89_OCTDE|nr:ubiquitin-conjugating enzyme E2 S [Octodon degus]